MGSVKGWELEAVVPDACLDLRGQQYLRNEVAVQRHLELMERGQILALLVRDSADLTELSSHAARAWCRLLKVEALTGSAGLRVWLERCSECVT